MFVSYMVKTLAILYSITFFLLEKYVGAPFFAEAHLLGSLGRLGVVGIYLTIWKSTRQVRTSL